MSFLQTENVKLFRERLLELSREELLEIIKDQDPQYIKHIERIEYVFKYKLRHLTWNDGSPVNGKEFTKEELALLIDPPFSFDKELGKLGFNEEQQWHIHVASDPVLWAKNFLTDKPRAYQTLVLRDQNTRKIMRFGRRLGKTSTMSFFSLWYSYTHNNGKIIIVAPMKSHVGLIYDEILRLAKQNELILNKEEKNCAITRKVMSPQYQIDFDNGSTIKFFTTGMKSNGRADVARGQEADVLILDEMDYMGKEDLIALLAMMQKTNENKDVDKMVWAASTPTGQRNKFWEWNVNDEEGFSAFWYPSYVNPNWNQKTEDQMRKDYPNEQAYKHEIEADWGEDVEGVYPHRFVKSSFIDTPIGDKRSGGGWDYIPQVVSDKAYFVFGVDWDKYGAGVNIVILEVCRDDYPNEEFAGKVRLIYREEVSKGEFTYTAAVERIIELNRIFRPKHIYVDKGSGDTQVELLHKYGIENPQSNLHRIVEGKQFAETTEVRDPYTKEIVKKRLKIFMVDNLYRMLEEERIIFPAQDEELYTALLSYIVLRTSITTGDPVFAAGGNTTDHAHDALILACFAIADNYDELLNMKFETNSVAVSSDFFMPTFELGSNSEKQLAEDKWGKDKGPVHISRSMAYNVRGYSRKSGARRKMF